MNHSRYPSQAGFTLIEFMVASVVFSTILLGVTAAVLYIQGTYQRSLYTSNTQQVAGNIVDAIADAIKFSNSDVTQIAGASGTSICIGNRQFVYVLGRRVDPGAVTTTTTHHGLVSQLNSGCATTDIVNPTTLTATGSQNLLDSNLRLINLQQTPEPTSPGLWHVMARVGYGEDDVFCSPSITSPTAAGSCSRNAPPFTPTSPAGNASSILTYRDLECHPQKLRYCAVSELSTTVFRRL